MRELLTGPLGLAVFTIFGMLSSGKKKKEK